MDVFAIKIRRNGSNFKAVVIEIVSFRFISVLVCVSVCVCVYVCDINMHTDASASESLFRQGSGHLESFSRFFVIVGIVGTRKYITFTYTHHKRRVRAPRWLSSQL